MLGGHMVWVGMSRGRFVGGRKVKAPCINCIVNRWEMGSHLSAGAPSRDKIAEYAIKEAKLWILTHLSIYFCKFTDTMGGRGKMRNMTKYMR
jgi:hypothetical protein